ncbi:flagellar brake protein [Phorcysia thermohydrogeniphila]|uniref:C-di-GMP-binding flagellar brake protein YcgR n=1 Tax=Phorcysia thermohydrogeniphila TaxID=936138 RepID=A0A4R1G8F0_9BACT|nr:PilZ domain-containing protein [Phorcysia thermohydrogeniphila]TCK03868.1 c-di-GMP-binding flagellar brake protein YcgR [Phorcysia thermohydrogeniphila]
MQKLSFLKFPTAGANTLLIFVLLIVAFLLFIMLAGLIREYLKEKKLRISFFKEASEKGLTEEEATTLWTYSRKFGRDPFLALEFKAPFERVVDFYLKNAPNPKEELVQDMRMKLGFDYIPYFVPLTSTKDIELFQTAKLYISDKRRYEIALFDKDERYMYWTLLEPVAGGKELVGVEAKITFIRKGDGIYTFKEVIEKTSYENGKLILHMPHTFELTRYQRREYARVEVELAASVGIYDRKEGKTKWVSGEIVDISAGGAKVCIPLTELDTELSGMTEIILRFELNGHHFNQKATVVNVYPRRHTTCYGVKFEQIMPEEQKIIHDFVKREQQRLAQLAIRNKG